MMVWLMLAVNVEASALSNSQLKVMYIAGYEGSLIGYPETLIAISYQETHSGSLGRIADLHRAHHSYGVMGVQVATAKDVLARMGLAHLFKNEDELIYALTYNDIFNIKIAAKYFEYLIEYFKARGDDAFWSRAVLAYNFGIGNVTKHGLKYDPNNYVAKVKQHIKTIVRPNTKRINNAYRM